MSKLIPTKLPTNEFLDSFKNVPRLAINLLIVNDGKLLLTKRLIPPFAGAWHYPGSFLLKDELITDCLKRISRDEIGIELTDEIKPQLIEAFDNINGDPRGHVVDLIYKITNIDLSLAKPTRETSEIELFSKLPSDIGFNQQETLHAFGFCDE